MFYRAEAAHDESDESIAKRRAGARTILILLAVMFVGCVAQVTFGTRPWSRTVVQRIEKAQPEIAQPKELTQFLPWIRSEIVYPKILRAKEHAAVGLWYASVGDLFASAFLLLTAQWWMPGGQRELNRKQAAAAEATEEVNDDGGFAKVLNGTAVIHGALFLAVVFGAIFRVEPLSHSLWNDEEYAMRRYTLGGVEDKTGQYEAVTWTETLFENHNGNNHVLHSTLARVSLGLWKLMHPKAKEGAFSEVALRMPSFIAGLLTILLLGWLGFEFGLPWVGVGAAWMLALHPWHVRYGAEAKGYSLCLFFIVLALIGLIRAMKLHRPSDWLLYGIAQAGFLLSFAGSLYVAIALNAVAFIECLVRWRPRRLIALIAINLMAAIPVLVWMMPSVPQLLGFMDHDNSPRLAANSAMLEDLGSHLVIGFQNVNRDTGEHVGTSWEMMRAAKMDATSMLGWGVAMLAALGLCVAAFEKEAGRLAILAVALAGGLSYWHASVQHHPNLAMYYIYLLIPLTLGCALAVVRFQLAPPALIMLMVGLYGLGTAVPRGAFVNHDRQPIRETVTSIYDKKPEALTGVFGVSDRQARSYDPAVRVLEKPADVDALLADAAAEGRPAFIYFAGLRETANRSPELLARVAQSEDLRPWKMVKGLEAMWTYHVYVTLDVR